MDDSYDKGVDDALIEAAKVVTDNYQKCITYREIEILMLSEKLKSRNRLNGSNKQMKKLHLTSFVFKTGSIEYKEQRIVVAEDLHQAYKKAIAWFPIEYTESVLTSCVVHPAIEDEDFTKDSENSPFNHGGWHDSSELPKKNDFDGYSSVEVICDVNGNRKDFRVGWYDFEDKEWRFHDTDKSWLKEEHLKWAYLPLAY